MADSNRIEYEVELKANDKDVSGSLNKIQNSLEKIEQGINKTFSGLTENTGTLNKAVQSIEKSLTGLNNQFKNVDVSKIQVAVKQLENTKKQINESVTNSLNSKISTQNITAEYNKLKNQMTSFFELNKNSSKFLFENQAKSFEDLFNKVSNPNIKSYNSIRQLKVEFENLKTAVKTTYAEIKNAPNINNSFERSIISAQGTLAQLKKAGKDTSEEYSKLNKIIAESLNYKSQNQNVLQSKDDKSILNYLNNIKILKQQLTETDLKAKNLVQTLKIDNSSSLGKQYDVLRQKMESFFNTNKNSKQFLFDSQITAFSELLSKVSNSTQQSHKEIAKLNSDFENLKISIKNTYKEYANIPNLDNKLQQALKNAQKTLSQIQAAGGGAYLSSDYSKLSSAVLNAQNYTGKSQSIQNSTDSKAIMQYIENIKKVRVELTNADLQAKVFLNNFKNQETLTSLVNKIDILKNKMIELKNSNSVAFIGTDFASRYDSIFNKLNNGSVKTANEIKQLNQEFSKLSSDISKKTQALNNAESKFEKLDAIINKLNIDIKKFKKLKLIDETTYNSLKTLTETITDLKQKFTGTNGNFKLNIGSQDEEIKSFLTQISQVTTEYNKLMASIKSQQGIAANNTAAEKLNAKYKELAANLQNFLRLNSQMGKDKAVMAEFTRIMNELTNNSDKSAASFNRLKAQVSALKREVYQKGLTGRSLSEELSYIFDKIGIKAMLGSAAYRTIGIVKEMVENVKELDTAMTTLKRVTSETSSYYQTFFENAKNDATGIGTTVEDLISATSDFSRAGFSNIDDAYLLAKNASIYSNVGFLDMSESTEHLTSVLNAFEIKAEDSLEVIDKFDKIGNEFSITSAGIGEALERSGSALVTANNSIDKSIALITAGNTIVQDPESVANGIRTIALRLRGAKAELEDLGEETDDLASSSAKMRDDILGLTGVDILTETGDFKDTYEILREISYVYDTLEDKSQAAVLEMIAGKNRANVAAAILSRFDIAESAYEASLNAAGTATKEMEVLAGSTEFKLTQLESAFQSLSDSLINTDAVKGFLTLFTQLLEGATKLFDKLGEFPSIVAIISAGLAALKSDIGFIKAVETDGKGLFGTGQKLTLGFGNSSLKQDKENLKNYVEGLKSVTDKNEVNTLFESTMRGSSKSAQEMAKHIGESVKDLEEGGERTQTLQRGFEAANRELDSMTLKSRAAAFGVQILKDSLNMIYNMAIAFAVSKAIEWVVNVVNAEKNAIEATKEKIQELDSSLEESQDKIADLEQQLEENKQKIAEINASPLSITQAEDLDNLKRQNLELESQLEILKQIEEQQKRNLQDETIIGLEQKQRTGYSNGEDMTIIDSIYDGMSEVQALRENQKELLSAGNLSYNEGYYQSINAEILNINTALSEDISSLIEQQAYLEEGSYYYNLIADAVQNYEKYLQELSKSDYISDMTNEIIEFERQANISGLFDSTVIDGYLKGNYFKITGEILPEFVVNTDNYDKEIAKLINSLTSTEGIFKQEELSSQLVEILDTKMMEGTLSEAESQLYEWTKYVQEELSNALNNIGGINKIDDQQQALVDNYLYMLKKIQAAMFLEDYISENNISLSALGTEEFKTFKNNFLNAARSSGFSQELAEEVFKGISEIEISQAEMLSNPVKESFNLSDYEEQIDAVQENFSTLQNALKSLFADTWTESDKVDLLQKFPDLTPYADDVDTLKEKVTELLDNAPNGLITELQKLKSVVKEEDIPAIDALIDKLQDITIDVEIDTLTDNINTAESELQKLNDYIETNNSGDEFFDNSSLYEILQLYPELKDKVLQTARGYKIEQGALEDVKKTRLETLQAGLQQELDNANAVVESIRTKLQGYGIEIEGINAVNDAKLKQAELEAQILQMQTEMLSANGSISAAQYISTQQAIKALQEFISANGKVSDTQNQMDALQLQVNQLGTSFASVDDEIDDINDNLDDTKDAIQDQIDAMEDMVDNLEDQLDDIDDATKDIEDLIDLTVAMIKKQKELEKEALNDELDRINKIIDGRKEQLKIEQEAYNYSKSLNEKTSNVNSIQTQLETLSNDDSMEAMKKRLELEQELKDAQSELDDFQYKHRIDLEEDALDKEKDYYEEFYDEKIKAIDDYLDKEGVIRSDAIDLINGKTQAFYNDLLYYTQTYTDMAEFEFNDLWNRAYAALEFYGNGQIDVLATLQMLSVQTGLLQAQIDGYNMSIQALNNTIATLEAQANATAAALQSMNDAKNAILSSSSVSFERNVDTGAIESQIDVEKQKLKDLEKELQNLYNQSNYNPNFDDYGQIEITRQEIKSKKELIEKLENQLKEATYHSGGLVKATNFDTLPNSLKSNEVFAKLMAGEVVVTEQQAANFMSNTLPKLTANSTDFNNINDSLQNISINIGSTIIEGNADENTINQIKQLQKQWTNDIFKQINKSVKNNGGGRNTKNIL